MKDRLEQALRKADEAGDVEAAQMLAAELNKYQARKKSSGLSNFGQGMAIGARNLKDGAVQRWDEGAAKLEQFFGTTLGDRLGMPRAGGILDAQNAKIENNRRQDGPVMSTTGGKIGNFTATALPAVAAAFVPGGQTYTGAALTGGLLGAAQPTAEGESAGQNTAMGALGGLGGQALGSSISRLLQPVQGARTAGQQVLAQKAQDMGIPLSVGQKTGSRPVQWMESAMMDMPFLSGGMQKFQEQQRQAFNRNLWNQVGEKADDLSTATFGQAKDRISQGYNQITNNNSVTIDPLLQQAIARNRALAASDASPAAASNMAAMTDELLSKAQGGQLPGTSFQNLRSRFGDRAKNSDGGIAFKDMKRELTEGMKRSLPEADSRAWQQLDDQYKNLKTIEPLVAKANEGVGSPALLLNEVRKSYPNMVSGGAGQMGDLAQIGNTFLKDLPNSGTAPRTFMNQMMNNPLTTMGASIPSMMMIPLQKALLSQGAAGNYISQGLIPMTPQLRGLLSGSGRAVGMGSAPALLSQ